MFVKSPKEIHEIITHPDVERNQTINKRLSVDDVKALIDYGCKFELNDKGGWLLIPRGDEWEAHFGYHKGYNPYYHSKRVLESYKHVFGIVEESNLPARKFLHHLGCKEKEGVFYYEFRR